jgi:hypothetical protein
MRRLLAFAAMIVCALTADAAAQIVQRPSRPYRGLFGGGPTPDPNRTRSELTLTSSLLVGHDTWLSPSGTEGSVDPSEERHSGAALTGDAALKFFRGRAERSIAVDGLVRSNGYAGIGAESTLGASGSVTGLTHLGRLTQLRVGQEFGYEPTLVLGMPAAIDNVVVDVSSQPPLDVSSGYLEQRSWSSSSFLNFDRRWSQRQTTTIGAAYSRVSYLDDLGSDTSSVAATASHVWLFNSRSSVRGLYQINDSELHPSDGPVTPMTTQNIEMSYGYARRLSPTRQLQLSVGGGATHVNTLNATNGSDLAYWMPAGSGSFSLDVGRSWSIAGDYSRSANVLQGVSLTSFATDAASASVSGLVSSRIEMSLAAMYSNGRSGGANTSGRFENSSGSAQLLYAISRCCATTVNYDYYVYHFENVTDLASGFPPNFDRQAIRVGFTVWLSLYGTYAEGGASRGVRRN